MAKLSFVVLLVLGFVFSALAQKGADSAKYAVLFKKQLACRSNPKAGKLLVDLQKRKFISRTYVVSDSVSYFKLHKPLRLWTFTPLAVSGFEQGYAKFFERGPGTSPPEMIGIIVRDSVPAAKAKLKNLGLENVRVEEHPYDLRGNINNSRSKLTEVMCWERY